MHAWNAVVQNAALIGLIISLLALAVSWIYSARQLKQATRQALSSESQAESSEQQAKSSEQMARLSLQQTELMRAQLDAAFRPVIEVVGSIHGTSDARLTVKNVGTGPAIAVIALCRCGWRESLGTLAPDGTRAFRFDYSFNLPPPPPVGPLAFQNRIERDIQPVPLRLEYASVSGAKWWTNVDFPLGTEPPIEFQHEHGRQGPSLPGMADPRVSADS